MMLSLKAKDKDLVRTDIKIRMKKKHLMKIIFKIGIWF
tara:strand:- start:172753 stop:172866 length:114 start_codon:yes stop_codon:yes gene_type:complete